MPYKDLEHDGNEEFQDIDLTSEEDVKQYEARKQKEFEEAEALEIEELQKEHMHLENPMLWDGDI